MSRVAVRRGVVGEEGVELVGAGVDTVDAAVGVVGSGSDDADSLDAVVVGVGFIDGAGGAERKVGSE